MKKQRNIKKKMIVLKIKKMDLNSKDLDKAYNAGYNDAMEKALKWLETINFEKDYIDVVYAGSFFKEEDFINDFRKTMEE